MRVFHSRTGEEIRLHARVRASDPADDFTVLSVKSIGRRRVQLSLVVGTPERIKHVIRPVTGRLWWKRVEIP